MTGSCYFPQAVICRGVRPRAELGEYSRLVLSVALSSLLKTRSVAEALDVDDGDAALDAAVDRFMKLFNGDWQSGRPEHHCCGASNRIPCHASLEAAREDMAGACADLFVVLIWRK